MSETCLFDVQVQKIILELTWEVIKEKIEKKKKRKEGYVFGFTFKEDVTKMQKVFCFKIISLIKKLFKLI